MNTSVLIASAMVVGFLALAAPVQAGVSDVKVTTDTSIDCSSIQTIARDLYGRYKTDQEKAIATWYFVRRLHFHWPHIPTWDSIDLINSYGFALCGHQSTMLCQIANAGGLKARTMHPQGHVIAEIYYDGAWHMLDCQVGWYALNRKGAVASCEELKTDPTLVTKAVEEKRASQPYFQCRDNPQGGTNYAATAKPGGSPQPPDRRLVINLRRGESITRVWGNEQKAWFPPKETQWTQPHHGCIGQDIDSNDPVNWPFWKPYAQVSGGSGEKVNYGWKRYYGNGRMVYEPDLATDAFTDGLAKNGMQGAAAKYQDKKGPNLHPSEVGKPGSVTFVIDSPYVAVDAWLDATGLRKTDADLLAVHARALDRGDWKEIYRADKTGPVKIANLSLKDAAWAGHGFMVKFEFKAGADVSDAGVDSLKVTTVFMNNMYALPYFAPGKNTISVTAGEGADLKKNKLTLQYVWEEQGAEKKLTQTVEKVPFSAAVEVPGKDLPRMKSVTLSVAP